jgi:transposase
LYYKTTFVVALQRSQEVGINVLCRHWRRKSLNPSADVGSYLGLAPRIMQAGLMARQGKISKTENSAARSLIMSSSLTFMRSGNADSKLRSWALSIEQLRRRMKAAVALARKLSTGHVGNVGVWKTYRGAIIEWPDAMNCSIS